jgi:O-succinylbenzoate synthase
VKIGIHHYELRPGPDPARAAAAARRGALLKLDFDDGATGYSDLHPWIEFGQAPLGDQLASLRSDQPAPLARLALRHARTDAAARRAGLSLFTGLPEIRSHALFTNWTNAPRGAFSQCVAEGYTAIKLKVGRDPARESAALNALAGLPLRWRLDANAAFTVDSLTDWLAELWPSVRANIEFIEDPCAYDPDIWATLAAREKIPLALDWELPTTPPPWPGAQVVVLKPAAQDAFTLGLAAAQAGRKIVVTHSMDHPLGRATALWTAMRLRQRHGDLVVDCGIAAGGLYEPDQFEAQAPRGPQAVGPARTGFGLDGLLEAAAWQQL